MIPVIKGILDEFAQLIKKSFHLYEIHTYLNSNQRFGSAGHIHTEEEHDFLVQMGMHERDIETETEDAIVYGEILRYFKK